VECFFTRIRELKWVGNRPTFKRICKRYPVHAFAVSEETQIWEVMLIQEALINVLLLDRIAFWRTTNRLALGAPAILAHKEDNSASVATPQKQFSEDGTSVHIMKQIVELIRLVRKSSVIQEDVVMLLTPLRLWCQLN